MTSHPIRVLLVEDSLVALTILKRLLAIAPDISVVATAGNGLEALELIPKYNPTIVCTDLHMPKMGGLELTRHIMAECPRPILVISAAVQEEDTDNVFSILQAGALDVFPKPRTGLPSDYEQTAKDLIQRIRVLSGVSVFTQHRRSPAPSLPMPTVSLTDIRLPRIIAIGASTGGPQALYSILKALPASFPVPIVVVQHISGGFLQGLVDWLNHDCALTIAIAEAGVMPKPGRVYFAPEGVHLRFDHQGCFRLETGVPVSGHCPSATALFEAIASYYRRSCVGILLTGMGRDGADGMQAIAQAGGTTIAQDEASCVVFGMPKEAIALNAVQYILPINRIAPQLLELFKLKSNKLLY